MTPTMRDMHVTKLVIPVLVSLIALSAAACSTDGETAADAAPLPPVPVTTARATMTDRAELFDVGGVLAARLSAAVSSRTLAPVLEVRVRAGDRVRRGAPLILLDAREVAANRDRATASMAAAGESAAAADADVAAAQAQLTLARTTHGRIAGLADKRSATAQELDQATSALAAAEANLRGATARLAAARANQDVARAAGAAADTAVSYAELVAPFDGVVTQRSVDPGSMATPGTPLLLIDDQRGFHLEVSLDASRARFVRTGQRVDVCLDDAAAAADSCWSSAPVAEIARIDPTSHMFLVKIDIPVSEQLRSGGFGRARFQGTTRRALTVPTDAVVRRGQLTFVFVADAEQTARLRAVSLGPTVNGRTEVTAGIDEGAVIVTAPPPALTDGRHVQGSERPDGVRQ